MGQTPLVASRGYYHLRQGIFWAKVDEVGDLKCLEETKFQNVIQIGIIG